MNQPAKTKEPSLCVFTRILGFSVFSNFVYASLDKISALDFTKIEYGHADTWALKPPRLTSVSQDLESAWRTGQLVKQSGVEVDAYSRLIIQGHQLAIPLKKKIKKLHTVIISDTTPALAHRTNKLREPGSSRFIKDVFMLLSNAFIYRSLFRNTDRFLVMSHLAERSLIEDYGVEAKKIDVIYPPLQYIEVDAAIAPKLLEAKSCNHDLPFLLFVGNAFERKGGHFLLSIFAKHFSERANLVIVSSDPVVESLDLPEQVIHLSNIPHEAVLSLFKFCDVFLFPTFKDETGLVLSEALATGTPTIARNAGAQGEWIKSGYNGELLPYDSDEQAWVEAIDAMLSDEATRQRYTRNCFERAAEMLSPERFDKQVHEAVLGI